MKRIILALFCLIIYGNLRAGQSQIFDRDYDTEARITADGIFYTGSVQLAVYNAQDTNGISVYITPESTSTATTYKVFETSISFTTEDGLYPGTTYLMLTESNKDTIGELVTFINAIPVGVLGAGNGITASLPQGSYDGNISTGLTVNHTATSIWSSTNTSTITLIQNAIYGQSYLIPASSSGDSINLTNLVVNGTFGSGTTYVNIYDGTAITDTQIRHEKITTTVVGKQILLGNDFKGTANTAMRIDIYNATAGILTASYMNFTYKLKQ